MYICIYIYIYKKMHIYVYIYIDVCVYIYMYIATGEMVGSGDLVVLNLTKKIAGFSYSVPPPCTLRLL